MPVGGSSTYEPFEVEGLMSGGRVRPPPSSNTKARASSSSPLEAFVAQACEPANRTRSIGVVAVTLLLVIVVAVHVNVNVSGGGEGEGAGSLLPSSAGGGSNSFVFTDPADTVNAEGGGGGDGEIVFADPVVDSPKGGSSGDEPAPADPPPQEEVKAKEEEEAPPPPPKNKPSSKVPPLEPDLEAGPIPDDKKSDLYQQWGGFSFWDGDEDIRPADDYMNNHPNHDIPGDDFPQDAWQTDAVYVNHYLDAGGKLVDRTMEAIFTEYGHGKPLPPQELATRRAMFHWEKIDLAAENEPPPPFRHATGSFDIGGWTTKRSFDGLVRRLLHAMMTKDTFTVVVTGHGAAQGEGNHFHQSYAMQFHRIMKPIFERLGVTLITHNFGQDGMGALDGGIAARDIYGHEIDLFLWDGSGTVADEYGQELVDLLLRQVLMSGNRVPLIWSTRSFDLLKLYHDEADVDVGEWGSGYAGLPETVDEGQADSLPWAAKYMKCSNDHPELCNDHRYSAVCWIDRPDGIKPARDQLDHPEGQDKGQPSWRNHQLQGRVLAFAVLEGLEVALNSWMEGTMTGQPLDDDYWHVTEYYDNIRHKMRNLNPTAGSCPAIANKEHLPARMCTTPMNGRTQYTPRAEKSLASIIKAAPSGYIPTNELKPLYEGLDVHNPIYDIPDGQIDVLTIAMGRRRRLQGAENVALPQVNKMDAIDKQDLASSSSPSLRRRLDEDIIPGEGWDIAMEPQGQCDGKYSSVCAHDENQACFLSGQQASRGALVGCEWSGWLVMTLNAVKEGIVVMKLQTWHAENDNPRTKDWTSVNGKRRLGEQEDTTVHDADSIMVVAQSDLSRRQMRSYDTLNLPDSFAFDYAINGKITTLNKDEFLAKVNQQRVGQTLTLLDDPEFTKEDENVEVAIRLRGAERNVFFGVSHIYWA
jgi:hypothetical protein